jgi:hypothetical protein
MSGPQSNKGQQVIVSDVRAAHVPVKVLGLQIERKHVRHDGVHGSRDVLGRSCLPIGRRDERRLPHLLQVLHFAHAWLLHDRGPF